MNYVYDDILGIIICYLDIPSIIEFTNSNKKLNSYFKSFDKRRIPSKNYCSSVLVKLPTIGANDKFYNDTLHLNYCGFCGHYTEPNIYVSNNKRKILNKVTGGFIKCRILNGTRDEIVSGSCPSDCQQCGEYYCITLLYCKGSSIVCYKCLDK